MHWLSCIRVPAVKRDPLMAFLAGVQIETRPFFPPMHRLPMYSDPSFRQGRPLPVAEELGDTGINLPTYTGLGDTDLDRVCQAILAGLER